MMLQIKKNKKTKTKSIKIKEGKRKLAEEENKKALDLKLPSQGYKLRQFNYVVSHD